MVYIGSDFELQYQTYQDSKSHFQASIAPKVIFQKLLIFLHYFVNHQSFFDQQISDYINQNYVLDFIIIHLGKMAAANSETDLFSHCKVCNQPTNKTTILKHMSHKKTIIGNVLRTCKDHNSEEYEKVKDAIAKSRKIKKRLYSQVYNEDNKESIRQKKAKRDATDRLSQDHIERKRISQLKYNQNHREENREREEMRRQKKQDETQADVRFKKFKLAIIHGPNFTCQSCNRQLFTTEVKFLGQQDLSVKHKLKPSFLKEVGLQRVIDVPNTLS